MAAARFLGWMVAAAAVAIAVTLIAGNDDDVPPRVVAPDPAPLPIVQAVARAAAASTGAAPVQRWFAPPAPAAGQQVPTPARMHEVEREVARLREAGGSDDDAYRLRALSLSPAIAAHLAEMEAAERSWQHEPSQRASGEAAARPQLVTE